MVEKVIAYGHRNITGLHPTTLELSMDMEISKRADCIIGVKADRAIKDLGQVFKSGAKRLDALIQVTLRVDNIEERIIGRGHTELTFEHPSDIVIRKSDFICNRTLMIKAEKSSKEIQRDLIERLKDPREKIEMQIEIIR